MLRCAGCGGLVSEFAARCPECRHSTDDAEDVEELESPAPATELARPDGNQRPLPEPAGDRPPLSQTRTRAGPWPLVGAAAAVLAAAVLTVEVRSSSDRGPPTPESPVAAQAWHGHVVGEAEDGTPFLARPDGTHRTVPGPPNSLVAPKRLLAGVNAEIVEVAGRRVALAEPATDFTLARGSTVALPDPFADHSGAVVVETGAGPQGAGGVSVVTLSDGAAVGVGTADGAAGDPEAVGAFVTVGAGAGPSVASGVGLKVQPDARVELRDAGRPAVTLATASQLNQTVGEDPGRPVKIGVFPDGDGRKVAVTLSPVDGSDGNASLVILGRDGSVLRSVPSADGPADFATVYWSPDGTSLAYGTFGSVGTELAVLNAAGRVAAQPLQPTTRVDGCTWSPDGAWVLCLAASESTDNWLLAGNTASLSPIYSLPAGGDPLAWLP